MNDLSLKCIITVKVNCISFQIIPLSKGIISFCIYYASQETFNPIVLFFEQQTDNKSQVLVYSQ